MRHDKYLFTIISTMKTFALANQKGGVGKTTSAVNIATALAAVGKKVLLIDLDPQANATAGLGLDKKSTPNIYELFLNSVTVSEVLKKTKIPGLTIIPSNINLIGAEIELIYQQEREFILKNKLCAYNGLFDYCLIDCPPSMGLLSLNALIASNYVIIPLQCEYYALEGLTYLMSSIKRVQQRFNPSLKLYKVLLTMFDRRSSLSIQVSKEAKKHLKEKVFHSPIPRNVRIAEAPSFGRPVLLHDINCTGSIAYMETAKEILHDFDHFDNVS